MPKKNKEPKRPFDTASPFPADHEAHVKAVGRQAKRTAKRLARVAPLVLALQAAAVRALESNRTEDAVRFDLVAERLKKKPSKTATLLAFAVASQTGVEFHNDLRQAGWE